MRVSVIVPIYNRLEHFRAQFICLLNQKEKPHELIITDDGSREDILKYIGDLIEKADFTVKHVYQKDKGFRKTRALNNGVRNSTGDFLVFCDQDLVFGDDYIELVKKYGNEKEFLHFRPINLTELERNEFIVQIEDKEFNYSNYVKNLNKEYKMSVENTLKKDRIRRLLYKFRLRARGVKLVGMSYAVSKRNYLLVNGYDEKYQGWGYEDDDFGNRLYAAGITGKECKSKDIQLHLWHPVDPTKKKSANEEYYADQKKSIFEDKKYFCRYGYDNTIDQDEVIVRVLKEVKDVEK